MAVANAHHQVAEWWAEVVGRSDNGGDKNQRGSDEPPARLRLQLAIIVAFQAKIGEAALLTFQDVFSLALRNLKAVVGSLEEYEDAKDAAQERASLVEREGGELTEYVPSSKDSV